jgi:DNA-binding transcriptional ArsR family regulator
MKDMDTVFKALAGPNRRKLLDRLYEDNGQTLTALCRGLDMTRQAVTQHLAILEAANLVTFIWRGREKFYYINPVPIHQIYERWIQKFEQQRLRALQNLKEQAEGKQDEKDKICLRDIHSGDAGKSVGGPGQR